MSGDMEQTGEAQVSYRLDDKEQEEFIQWFGRSFLRRKRDAQLAGMNFQTYPRPDVSNLKEDTKIRMESRSIHIWSGQKELNLLYSALTDLEETGTLILFFAQKEFWAVPKRALGGEDGAGKWLGQLKAFCSRGICERTDFEAVRERCRRNGSRCFYFTRTVDQVMEAYMGLGRKEKELQNLRNLAVFPYRYAGVQALTLEPDGIYEYGERSMARHLYGDLKSAVYTRDCLYLIKGDGEEIMLPVDCLDGMGEPGQERLENREEPEPEPPLCISRFLAVCNGRRPPGLPGLNPVKLDTPKTQERSKRRVWIRSRLDPDRRTVMNPYRKHGKSGAGWFSEYRKRKEELSGRRWWKCQKKRNKQKGSGGMGHPVSGYMLIGMTALITVAIAIWGRSLGKSLRTGGHLDYFYHPGVFLSGAGYFHMIDDMSAEAARVRAELLQVDEEEQDRGGADDAWKAQYMVTVPDDTVFDQVGKDGTYVSSKQYFTIQLPPGEWEDLSRSRDDDHLASSWAHVVVRGYRTEGRPRPMTGTGIPKTKDEYMKQMKANMAENEKLLKRQVPIPQVAGYTYQEKDGCILIRKEIRSTEGDGKYSLDLSLMAPEYTYTVSIWLEEETPENIGKARAVLDSFRLLDISTGICRQMEDAVFRGYYGRNIVMTSCLVLLEEEMGDEDIRECLDKVKKIDKGFIGSRQGQALAVRSKDSRWLGIDSPSLQQNCYEPNARKVSEIFRADVILYDEFDGNLLMVAYCSKDQKHSCQRATSFHKDILEQEFQCYGAEQKFPEELLQYMDLSMEEASAIWEDMDVVFQIEKWEALASHMTRMPVPREFIGMWDIAAFGDGFEVIRQ